MLVHCHGIKNIHTHQLIVLIQKCVSYSSSESYMFPIQKCMSNMTSQFLHSCNDKYRFSLTLHWFFPPQQSGLLNLLLLGRWQSNKFLLTLLFPLSSIIFINVLLLWYCHCFKSVFISPYHRLGNFCKTLANCGRW